MAVGGDDQNKFVLDDPNEVAQKWKSEVEYFGANDRDLDNEEQQK